MTPQLPPSLEHELFATALGFRRAEPWQRLSNGHYLLIGEPERGRRALTVLGNGGLQFGLQSYASSCAAQWLVLTEELQTMALASPTVVFELLDGVEVDFVAKRRTCAHESASLRTISSSFGYRFVDALADLLARHTRLDSRRKECLRHWVGPLAGARSHRPFASRPRSTRGYRSPKLETEPETYGSPPSPYLESGASRDSLTHQLLS